MSRIFATVDKFPLPDHACKIDVQLKDGSKLIGCSWYSDEGLWRCCFHNSCFSIASIVSWREHKDEITIDWPTESNFSFGSDK